MTAAAPRRTAAIGRFLAWWGDELAALLPASVRRLLGITPDILIVESGSDGLTAGIDRGGRYRPLGPLADLRDRPAGAAPRQVALRLPPDQALVREFELPLAAEENLREVLEFEMERQTPFRADQVAFFFRVLGRDADRARLRLWLAAIPRERLREKLAQVEGLGLRPVLVSVGAPGEPLLRRPAIYPDGAAPSPFGRADRLLAGLALVLLVLLAVVPIWLTEARLAALETEAAALRPVAERALALEREIAAEVTGEVSVAAAKAGAPAAVQVVEELSRLLPDDTYLAQLSVTGDEVALEGRSASAAALVAVLEGSPLFANARFRTPVMRDPLIGREHFNLVVSAVRR